LDPIRPGIGDVGVGEDELRDDEPDFDPSMLYNYATDYPDDFYNAPSDNDQSSGCPYGCTYRKPGCDIKGNISISTGEKIYHVPGQEYYAATEINSQYGERWFCTEAEARANGWRKAYQ